MDYDFTTVDPPNIVWDFHSGDPGSPCVHEPLVAHRRTWLGA
jgi:hypothetical protein